MRIAICIALLSPLLSLSAHAEDTWSRVQSLRKGDRIAVIQSDGKRVEGRFDSATESRITLQAGQPISLEKSDVVRVAKPARHGRAFGAVVGGLIGLAAGGVTDATLGQYFRNETGGAPAGVITAAGAGIGVAFGAAVSGNDHTVYRR